MKVEIMATATMNRWINLSVGAAGSGKAVVTNVIVTPLSEQPFDNFSVIQKTYPHDL